MSEKHNLKILILDEQDSFKNMSKETLLASGYRNIETTDDPILALEQIKREMVDVVIFDVIISKIDGLEFMRRISLMNLSKKPMLIVCSAISIDSVISQMIALGADYYMIKPLSYDVLVERINMLLPKDENPDNEKNRIFSKQVPLSKEDLEFELEKKVTAVISEIGIPAHIKGYNYLRAAIIMAIKNPETTSGGVTKIIYPTIAKMFNTSASRVERAIRHAIESTWNRGNIETLDRFFGYTIDENRGKPTNSQFIAIIAETIRLGNKEFKNLSNNRTA